MSLSASARQTTDFHREPKWDPPRRAFGIVGACITVAGLGIFVYFFSSHHFDASATAHGMGFAALAVTLSLGGLQIARWGFGSQRAYDTKKAFIEDLLAIFGRLDDIAKNVAEVQALTAQAVQDGDKRGVSAEQIAAAVDAAVESAVRKVYTGGFVDALDGRAPVLPINGSLRGVPPQDQRR